MQSENVRELSYSTIYHDVIWSSRLQNFWEGKMSRAILNSSDSLK